MKRSFVFLSVAIIVLSCNKETDDFLWEKSYGPGTAYFIRSLPDSGIISCGTLNGYPYLLKLKKDRTVESEFTFEKEGLFSSAWSGTSRYIAAGSSDGKMLLAFISTKGNLLWDTLIAASFRIRMTSLVSSGSGSFTAVGTARSDSIESGTSGILFVRFDSTGFIGERKETAEASFVAAGKVTSDASGNILLPLTRKKLTSEPLASIAKYSGELNKLWETELCNNTSFGAASLDAIADDAGNAYIAGTTEVTSADSVLKSSFLAALTSSGTVKWKKYLEKTNSGTAIILDDNELLMMLNINCFIVNMANTEDGTDEGRIRMFEVCDPKSTDAFGEDLDIYYDGSLIVAGTRAGNYYLALESYIQ
ncbi:MAG: WD40 repeat domain-containing protein [Bacteroidota bacterium]